MKMNVDKKRERTLRAKSLRGTFSLLLLLSFAISSCINNDNCIDDENINGKIGKKVTNDTIAYLDFSEWVPMIEPIKEGKSFGTDSTNTSQPRTRAGDGAIFHEGDEFLIWAVKRINDQVAPFKPYGNLADARRYILRNGRVQPKTQADNIILGADKVDLYLLHAGNMNKFIEDAGINNLQGMTNATMSNAFVNALTNVSWYGNSSQDAYRNSLVLLAKSLEGYNRLNTQFRSVTFDRMVTLLEIDTEKVPNEKYIEKIQLSVIADKERKSLKYNMTNGFTFTAPSLESLGYGSSKAVIYRTFLASETNNKRIFKALLPPYCSIINVRVFQQRKVGNATTLTSVPAVDIPVTNFDPLVRGTKNSYKITYKKDVMAWEYELSYNYVENKLDKDLNAFVISSKGGYRDPVIVSKRYQTKNGVRTGVVENVPVNITFEGASVFRRNGNLIGAPENTTKTRYTGKAVISQSGGKTIKLRLLQLGKYDIGTNI